MQTDKCVRSRCCIWGGVVFVHGESVVGENHESLCVEGTIWRTLPWGREDGEVPRGLLVPHPLACSGQNHDQRFCAAIILPILS